MKKLITLIALISIIACKNEAQQKGKMDKTISTNKAISDADLESAVIYEANIRQYSAEGTFSNFTKDIPQLKQLGVKIIWLMPIYPISNTKSKGPLGSYYAITDYTKVNPEFGNLEDVKNLVKTAHNNGMFVILDWVANHTGWDHEWIKKHPDYYTQDDKGNIISPKGTDWTDVADLNYDNKSMRAEMIEDMSYWLKDVDVDGFRCDVAGSVPVDFWNNATKQLRKIKPIFMLAEAWEPKLLKNAFDMDYGWDTHHIMNEIAQGKKNVKAWDKRRSQLDTIYQKDDFMMNFITNHDENSWSGTVKERLGDASNTMLALTYCTPGMPLIYSGQEYDMNKRLRFFDKDTISKVKGKVWPLLEKLGKLKNTNIALNGGKSAASYQKINSSNNDSILIFKREKEGKKLFYMANLSNKKVSFTTNLSGEFLDYISQRKIHLIKGQKLIFKPWEYKILVP
jgi:1,4-alpha-glucan branching enzyme